VKGRLKDGKVGKGGERTGFRRVRDSKAKKEGEVFSGRKVTKERKRRKSPIGMKGGRQREEGGNGQFQGKNGPKEKGRRKIEVRVSKR